MIQSDLASMHKIGLVFWNHCCLVLSMYPVLILLSYFELAWIFFLGVFWASFLFSLIWFVFCHRLLPFAMYPVWLQSWVHLRSCPGMTDSYFGFEHYFGLFLLLGLSEGLIGCVLLFAFVTGLLAAKMNGFFSASWKGSFSLVMAATTSALNN